jgi:hypothetical protein
MKLLFQSLVFVFSLNAVAQTESGSLIIVNASQDEIVVAADSRSYSAVAEFDDRCKITALDNQLIFAASGITAYGPTDGRPLYWDSHAIAKEIFLHLSRQKATQPMPLRIAPTWGKEIKNKFKADLKRDGPKGVLFGAEGNTLTSAVFAGFYQGAPLIVTLAVRYITSTKGHTEVSDAITNVFRKPKAVQIGRVVIADELFAGKTPRAIQWRQQLAYTKAPDGDSVALPAIDAVKFSIDNYPLVNIGGKMLPPLGGSIDAVRLRLGKGIDWIQRKTNCPEN